MIVLVLVLNVGVSDIPLLQEAKGDLVDVRIRADSPVGLAYHHLQMTHNLNPSRLDGLEITGHEILDERVILVQIDSVSLESAPVPNFQETIDGDDEILALKVPPIDPALLGLGGNLLMKMTRNPGLSEDLRLFLP